jgi:pilus assembly protein CpaC
MNRRIVKNIFTAACALTPLALVPAAPAQAQSVMRPANDIALSIGRGQLVNVAGSMADVFVADDKVADVQVKSNRQLYVFGKAGGETTIYASNASGDVIWSANVRVGSNIDSIDQMLNLAMPDAKINVSTIGTNTFLLTGTIGSPEDGAEAQRLVSAFVSGGSSAAAGAGPNVISRLRMATPLQVNLQVRIAEVSRSFIRNLGVNLTSIDPTSGFKFGIGQGREGFNQFFRPGSPLGVGNKTQSYILDPVTGLPKLVDASSIATNTTGSTLGFAGKLLGMDLLGALDAAEQVGLVSTLAQPNLTALSGETADFLAGGEYPIPIAQGLGTTTVEYKKYGVSLAYTPTVLSNGRISLRVRPEVSELSSDGAVVLNGYQIPSLTIRRAETTIELGSGQAFMIAGLMSNRSQNAIDKMPGAGDLPILGSLFRSTQYRKGETELVIVVTPYLVNPVNDRDIVLPTDGFRAPDELQRLLGNMESDGISGGKRAMPTTAPEPVTKPSVGDASLPPAGVSPQQTDDRNSRSNRKSADAATTPAPGFNLD